MEELITQLTNILKGGWKYRWQAVAVAWLIAIVGWVVVIRIPNTFQSSARIYVDTQSILRPLMSGMVLTPNVQQQVSIMSRTLLSRPNIERVMRMVDLDIKADSAKDNEKILKNLMDNITIASTERDDLYIISCSNTDPKIAKNIVQALLTIFVEGSIGDKSKDNTSVMKFLNEQISIYEEKLVAAESAVKEFREKNMENLPRQGTDYSSQRVAVADERDKAALELKEAEQSRDSLKSQINGGEPTLASEDDPSESSNPEIDARISSLNNSLDTLRLNFTELHPDVIASKRLIARLQERKREEAKLPQKNRDVGKNYSPMLQQLHVDLAQAESRVSALKARVAEYTQRYDRLKAMSNLTLETEASFSQLNRDYQINKANYDQLVQRRESAKMSSNLRDTTELMTFKIIDPPTTPLEPSAPNRLRLYSLVFAAALGAGLGIAFLLSQIRPTFHSQSDLGRITGLPVLGEVARIWTDHEKSKHKRNLYFLVLSLSFLLLIFILLMVKTVLKITF